MGKDKAGGGCATGAKKLRKEKRPAATGLFEKIEWWSVNHLCNYSITLIQFVRMGQVAKRDFVKYHLREALRGAAAEVEGDEDLSRRLRAETRLRLIGMSDEQLWELAKQTSCPPEMPVELAYKRHKQAIEELEATASEWMNDLKIPIPDSEGRNGR